MQQTFTKQFMIDNRGCYTENELLSKSFMPLEVITLEAIINSEIPLKDKYWFVCKKLATKEENQQIAITVAEMVLPIFEKNYPNDKRPRNAIEASKSYLKGEISLEELLKERNAAAYAAYAAAYAAYAAAAADAAADAAYAAADADAAYAAAYAAYAAAAADAAAAKNHPEIKNKLFDYLKEITHANITTT